MYCGFNSYSRQNRHSSGNSDLVREVLNLRIGASFLLSMSNMRNLSVLLTLNVVSLPCCRM